MYNFPDYGFDEIEGIHDRTNYDLTQHMKFSGTDLNYNDNGPDGQQKFIPWILETSLGLGRVFLALLSEVYDKEKLDDGTERTILRFKKKIAPVKISIFPLMKKDGMPELAKEIFKKLSGEYNCQYSETASIGKRYRKADEIGVPFCITVDYDSLKDETVTIRERDSMEQKRIKIVDLEDYFFKEFHD